MPGSRCQDSLHYRQRLEHAIQILDVRRRLIPANREKTRELLGFVEAEGLNLPRRVRYTIVLRKLLRLIVVNLREISKADSQAIKSAHQDTLGCSRSASEAELGEAKRELNRSVPKARLRRSFEGAQRSHGRLASI